MEQNKERKALDRQVKQWAQERDRLNDLIAHATGAEPATDAQPTFNHGDWIRNNYQDYPNIASLVVAMNQAERSAEPAPDVKNEVGLSLRDYAQIEEDAARMAAEPAPIASPAERQGDCKCRRLGDWNGEHHPLCDAAQPAAKTYHDTTDCDECGHIGITVGANCPRCGKVAAQPAADAPTIPALMYNGDTKRDPALRQRIEQWSAEQNKKVNAAIDRVFDTEPAPADRQGVALSEREAFEALSRSRNMLLDWCSESKTYWSTPTRLMWEGWQARASSSRAEVEIPKGYALVPNKLTTKMRQAFVEAARRYMAETGGNNPDAMYEATLAAAEAPNGEGSDGDIPL